MAHGHLFPFKQGKKHYCHASPVHLLNTNQMEALVMGKGMYLDELAISHW